MKKSELVNFFVETLKKEKGVRESNNNSGERVRLYQSATTLGGTHWPWCAALLAWAIKKTEVEFGYDIPWSFSASCDVLWAHGKEHGLMRSTPKVGDVFLVKAKRGNGYSTGDAIHTGAVIDVNGNSFTTVEGNTNSGGGAEGIGVMSHMRDVSARYAFIRWIDGVAIKDEVEENPWKITLVDKGQDIDLKAIMVNGANYVSAREVAQALGIEEQLEWDPTDGEVSIAHEVI